MPICLHIQIDMLTPIRFIVPKYVYPEAEDELKFLIFQNVKISTNFKFACCLFLNLISHHLKNFFFF